MKKIIFAATLLFQTNTFAQTVSCVDLVLDVYYANYTSFPDAYKIPEKTKSCLIQNEKFKNVMSIMCESDQTLKSEYKKFMNYAVQYKLKLRERDAALSQSEKEVFNSDLIAIENEWLALGYRRELYPPIGTISELVSSECWAE